MSGAPEGTAVYATAQDANDKDKLSPWWKRILISVIIIASIILTYITLHAYHVAPPIPGQVVDQQGQVVATKSSIEEGQQVFQRYGLMNNGSVWGHGAYIGPDFAAYSLHHTVERLHESVAFSEFGESYKTLPPIKQAAVNGEVALLLKKNNYSKSTDTLSLNKEQAEAWRDGPALWTKYFHDTVWNGGLEPGIVPTKEEMTHLADWFNWAAWASATARPGTENSYTNNFPYEPGAGNTPIRGALIWSMLSLLTLLGGIGAAVFIRDRYPSAAWVTQDYQRLNCRLWIGKVSEGQKALAKYMVIVAALFFVQTLLGGATAHYRADPASFYGLPLQKIFPSNLLRSWHLQLAVFWVATSYVSACLYIALGFRGPDDRLANSRGLKVAINLLFVAFVVVVVGSLLGIWAGYLQIFGRWWELLGATGWEFMEQGRLWHGLLLVGLFAWMALLWVICSPVWKRSQQDRPMITAFLLSALAIPVFYLPVLFIGDHTNYSVVEIWRFWIIHLWVEGYFEFFATALIATVFYLLGIVPRNVALRTIYFDGILFFLGGVLGTCHHWYFTGQGQMMMAFGALMSALEVVPLTLLCAEAWDFIKRTKLDRDDQNQVTHKWVYAFLLSAGFWNFVGAGMCGFFINLPIVSYYEVGTMLTPNHGHAAMMGVFGMMALAMLVLVLQQVSNAQQWKKVEKWLRIAFWGTNIGLAGMCLISLFPGGLFQLYDVMSNGYWHARSLAYSQSARAQFIEWIRMVPDVVFILFGSLPIVIFALRTYGLLITNRSNKV
ncbi:nitric-oxide reductase large subunit [Aristophania vespae]|uniref:Nitric-oxide reductase large subunit n=1 Tax=Aristophania vespae TaxID=2697033 RepID=A0A6P1NEM7_9PROT|nr:cbb3-type cytochrome c oxidase subunit I [Aristophania vespae]QHI95979.1 nitric-oxide reductase large subunit [Aristophania vespae]UMM63735.1 hypothetical protein DM15PD_07110 [Aristophania vespae]